MKREQSAKAAPWYREPWPSVYKRQRLFCGYACPQTVYTEILMWIERKIEGERPARIKLDAQPMSMRKFRLKLSKHSLWLVVALWTGCLLYTSRCV